MTLIEVEDRAILRDLIENWAIWRDSADWDRLRSVWHPDGIMVSTWFQGPAEQFIQASEAGWNRGVSATHFLGGSLIDLAGERAVAQTKMTIGQRSEVHGVLCDCVCSGRFYDFFEKRDGRWGMVRRQPIYEKDRLDPVEPGKSIDLDRERLAQLPEAYRHLAYVQTSIGMNVDLTLPQLRGPAVEAVYSQGKLWLKGAPPEQVFPA